MGERDLLVGPSSLVQVLKNKLAMVPQATCNLVCLETGSAGISAYRPVRGELAMLPIEPNQNYIDQSHDFKDDVDWPN